MINQKTIKIKLDHSNFAKIDKLSFAYNQSQLIAHEYLEIKKQELESKDYTQSKGFYKYARIKYPTVNSALLQQIQNRCDEQVKSYRGWCKKSGKEVKFNSNPNMPIMIRDTSLKISKTAHFDYWLSLWRTDYPLRLCTRHLELVKRSTRAIGSKIKKSKNGTYVLYLTLEFVTEQKSKGKSLGIDLGIVQPIVCSDGKFIGSGKHITHMKLEFGKKRARTKKEEKKDKISDEHSQWTSNLNHKLSRELVDHCLQNDVNVLYLEKLKGTELSNAKYRKFKWAFKDLLMKIEYKAQIAGISVIGVNPAYTSRTCSCCGSKGKSNRQTQSRFACKSCGYVANADVNAAKNILNSTVQNGPTVSMAMSKASNSEVTIL